LVKDVRYNNNFERNMPPKTIAVSFAEDSDQKILERERRWNLR